MTSSLLKDLLIETKDGEWGLDSPGDGLTEMRVIRGTDFGKVRFGDLSSAPIRFIPGSIALRKSLRSHDILIETAGGTVDMPTGRTVFLKEGLFRDGQPALTCASFSRFLRPDPERIYPAYLFWFLQSLYQAGEMVEHQVQHTGVARFQYTKFAESTKVPLPPMEQQVSISSALSTLDDKIELNRKMNETLEAIARAIFRSWFVEFDPVRIKALGGDPTAELGLSPEIAALFPDCFQDSELGDVPAGWESGSLASELEFIGGGTPSTSRPEYWGGSIPWYSVVDAPFDSDIWVVRTSKTITEEGLKNSSTRLLPQNTVIISARGTVGKLAMAGHPMAMNQSCYGLRGIRSVENYWTYFQVKQLVADLQARSHGSVFDTITRSTFDQSTVVRPPTAAILAFDLMTAPLFQLVKANLIESDQLASTRDYLLPLLLSGRVDVSTGGVP